MEHAYLVTITTDKLGIKFVDWEWESSPKRAAARFAEEFRDYHIYHLQPQDARDIIKRDSAISIQVQRFGDVGHGLEFEDLGPLGPRRHYAWNGISTTTRNGYIPHLQIIGLSATSYSVQALTDVV
jgi:hypothetical protein